MNLDIIRDRLYSILNQSFSFYYNGLRGQADVFDGRIIRIFPRVFLIETSNHVVKCFSYSDFATKTLKICNKRK